MHHKKRIPFRRKPPKTRKKRGLRSPFFTQTRKPPPTTPRPQRSTAKRRSSLGRGWWRSGPSYGSRREVTTRWRSHGQGCTRRVDGRGGVLLVVELLGVFFFCFWCGIWGVLWFFCCVRVSWWLFYPDFLAGLWFQWCDFGFLHWFVVGGVGRKWHACGMTTCEDVADWERPQVLELDLWGMSRYEPVWAVDRSPRPFLALQNTHP